MENQSVFLRQYHIWSFWWSTAVLSLALESQLMSLSQLFGYACANLAGAGGYNGWRWIFIIEGLITVVAGALAKHFVVDWPETSSFLNNQERALLERRIREDTSDARMDHFDKNARSRAFRDWKIYIWYVGDG